MTKIMIGRILLDNCGWHDRWSDTYVITQAEHEEIAELLKLQPVSL